MLNKFKILGSFKACSSILKGIGSSSFLEVVAVIPSRFNGLLRGFASTLTLRIFIFFFFILVLVILFDYIFINMHLGYVVHAATNDVHIKPQMSIAEYQNFLDNVLTMHDIVAIYNNNHVGGKLEIQVKFKAENNFDVLLANKAKEWVINIESAEKKQALANIILEHYAVCKIFNVYQYDMWALLDNNFSIEKNENIWSDELNKHQQARYDMYLRKMDTIWAQHIVNCVVDYKKLQNDN
jgi:hypothetical protein